VTVKHRERLETVKKGQRTNGIPPLFIERKYKPAIISAFKTELRRDIGNAQSKRLFFH
jgi:hypothetical protein